MKTRIIVVIAITLVTAGIIVAQNNAKKVSAPQENQTKTEMKQQSPTPTQGNTQVVTPNAQGTNAPTVAPSLSPQAQGQGFELRGAVTSISGNSFVLSGNTIVIDKSKVVNFQQTTLVEIGKTIQVEGVTINGVMYAREIKLPSQGGKN